MSYEPYEYFLPVKYEEFLWACEDAVFGQEVNHSQAKACLLPASTSS